MRIRPEDQDLLPCPFCGSVRIKVETQSKYRNCNGQMWVRCCSCGARCGVLMREAGESYADMLPEVTAMWNQRAKRGVPQLFGNYPA